MRQEIVSRLRWLAVVGMGVVACSLTLNTNGQGHTCGPNGTCLAGFVCNGKNVCVPEGSTDSECNGGAGCPALEACVRQQCVPICAGRACPSGTFCDQGSCVVQPRASSLSGVQQLGATCTSDEDCTGISPSGAPLYCLIPYGGHSAGFCTTDCMMDSNCGGLAPTCQMYTSEPGSSGVMICAPASCEGANATQCSGTSLVQCVTDADCAQSGLACGVYATGQGGHSRSITACRAPIPDGGMPGDKCDPSSARNLSPCTNGLCVQASAKPNDWICTATCGTSMDCSSIFTGTPGSMGGPACVPVTVGGNVSGVDDPYVRAQMCVPHGITVQATHCDTNPAACGPDAPNCVEPVLPAGSLWRCAPHCTSNSSLECPAGLSCAPAYLQAPDAGVLDGGNFCE